MMYSGRIGAMGAVDQPAPARRAVNLLWRWLVNAYSGMPEVQVGQVWVQVSRHERGMQLEVVRPTGRRWVLRPVRGGPS